MARERRPPTLTATSSNLRASGMPLQCPPSALYVGEVRTSVRQGSCAVGLVSAGTLLGHVGIGSDGPDRCLVSCPEVSVVWPLAGKVLMMRGRLAVVSLASMAVLAPSLQAQAGAFQGDEFGYYGSEEYDDGYAPLPSWFEGWLLGRVLDEETVSVESAGVLEDLEAARMEVVSALDPERPGDLRRKMVAALSGLRAAERDLRSVREGHETISGEMDRLVLALAAALSESTPYDLRSATLLEDALVELAPRLSYADSRLARAQERLSVAEVRADAAESDHREYTDRRDSVAQAYALLVFDTASTLSGRSWGYGEGPACPLFAPGSTLRADQATYVEEEGVSVSSPVSPPPEVEQEQLSATYPPHPGAAPPLGVGYPDLEVAPLEGWSAVFDLCVRSSAAAAAREASAAVRYGFNVLGAPYACDGVGRTQVFRYDCSSFVGRAFSEGAGIGFTSEVWAPSTRDMVPWDGHALASWVGEVEVEDVRPGDMWLYDTGLQTSRHVVMMLSDGLMIHTNRCGDVLHITRSWVEDMPSGVRDLGPRRAFFEGFDPPEVRYSPEAGDGVSASRPGFTFREVEALDLG